MTCTPLAIGSEDWIDITNRIRNETDLEKRIQDTCQKECKGNRRNGGLDWLKVKRIDTSSFHVTAKAYARNHEHQKTPVGGGFAVFDWTLHLTANGKLDLTSCKITINSATATGGTAAVNKSLEDGISGKTHDINNCRNIVRGL